MSPRIFVLISIIRNISILVSVISILASVIMNKPHISLPEAIIMLIIAAMSDAFELLVTLVGWGSISIPFIGWLITAAAPFVVAFENLLTLALLQFWLIMKGVRSWIFGVGGVIDFVPLPGVSGLNLKTLWLAALIIRVNKGGSLGEKIPLAGKAVKTMAKK